MPFDIIHISDLHFGNVNGFLKSADVHLILNNALDRAGEDVCLVISGDITYKGLVAGYAESVEIIAEVLKHRAFDLNNLIVCPGNHDLIKNKNGGFTFSPFDAWSSRLRNDKACTFSNTSVRVINTSHAVFVVLNTSYHFDHEYGLVDVAALRKCLLEIDGDKKDESKPFIAIAHHHLIPVLQDDKSTIRNSYEFIRLLSDFGFCAILHGHQHAMLNMQMGDLGLRVFGVGSFGFSTQGVINTLALYRFNKSSDIGVNFFGVSLDLPRKVTELKF